MYTLSSRNVGLSKMGKGKKMSEKACKKAKRIKAEDAIWQDTTRWNYSASTGRGKETRTTRSGRRPRRRKSIRSLEETNLSEAKGEPNNEAPPETGLSWTASRLKKEAHDAIKALKEGQLSDEDFWKQISQTDKPCGRNSKVKETKTKMPRRNGQLWQETDKKRFSS